VVGIRLLIDARGQIVIGACFEFAVDIAGVVLFGFESHLAPFREGVAAFVTDANFQVAFIIFVPAPLGVH
jgi:hypothetical protein